jgi:hypothetical protein
MDGPALVRLRPRIPGLRSHYAVPPAVHLHQAIAKLFTRPDNEAVDVTKGRTDMTAAAARLVRLIPPDRLDLMEEVLVRVGHRNLSTTLDWPSAWVVHELAFRASRPSRTSRSVRFFTISSPMQVDQTVPDNDPVHRDPGRRRPGAAVDAELVSDPPWSPVRAGPAGVRSRVSDPEPAPAATTLPRRSKGPIASWRSGPRPALLGKRGGILIPRPPGYEPRRTVQYGHHLSCQRGAAPSFGSTLTPRG